MPPKRVGTGQAQGKGASPLPTPTAPVQKRVHATDSRTGAEPWSLRVSPYLCPFRGYFPRTPQSVAIPSYSDGTQRLGSVLRPGLHYESQQ